MHLLVPVLTASLALAISACAPPDPLSGSDGEQPGREVDQEVRATSEALVAAMNDGDAEQVLGFYLEDPGFTYLGCTSTIVGGATFRTMVAPFYSREAPPSFEFEVIASRAVGPDAAVLMLRGRSTDAPALFVTQTWVRADGGWKIALVHESWPGCSEPAEPHPFTGTTSEVPLQPESTGN